MATENLEYRSAKPDTRQEEHHTKNRGTKDDLLRTYLQNEGQQGGETNDDGVHRRKQSKRETQKGVVR